MPYSSEVIGRARQRLENEKTEKRSRYYANLEQAYREVPRLRQIDMEMKGNVAKAVQSAFSEGLEAMTKAKKANEALQNEWNALAEKHFPKGFLEDAPYCPHCGGLGYVGKEMCSCLKELCRQEQLQEVKNLSCGQNDFADFRLDYYSDRVDPKIGVSPWMLMENNLRTARRFVQQFQGNLLLVGGTGLGKTFLSSCIATAIAEQGYSVTYESAAHLFGNMEKDRFNPDEKTQQIVRRYAECDLLIIDDLGTELPGNFVTAALYNLVNDRLLARKPMVISTNLTVDEIRSRYSAQIASRLQGSFTGLTFFGEDIRVLKSRGVL